MRLRVHLRDRPDLIPPGSRVIVALSGGSDSTALLHLLAEVAPELDLHLEAAHFDHRVRQGSDAEAAVAREIAAGLGLTCHAGAPPITPKVGQASLRAARYRWLNGVVRERGADRLAVGHQADDQAETVLFRVMRGTDLRGLSGVPVRRGRIVRPLLPFRRRELIRYLQAVGGSWLDDPSNSDRRWTRSRVRMEMIPELETGDPATVERLVALGRAAGLAWDLCERVAGRLLAEAAAGPTEERRRVFHHADLVRGGPEILAVAVRRLARERGVELTAGGTRAAVEFISEGRSGGRVHIGGGLEARREYDRVIIGPESEPPDPDTLMVGGHSGAGRVRIGGRVLDVRWRTGNGGPMPPERIAVPVLPGHYPLMFRSWRHGDRIRLAGGSRKLKRLFADRRVPLSERTRLPVLADRQGNILWIEGLATATCRHGAGNDDSFLEFELSDE